MRSKWKKCGPALALALVVGAALPAFANNGDPLVSLSYLNKRLEQIESKLNGAAPSQGGAVNLEVVNLQSGDVLIVAQGTEMIPRTGSLTAIAGASGGLSDITEGANLDQDKKASLDHLLIAPRSDGRGLKARTDAIVMVRGSYRVDK